MLSGHRRQAAVGMSFSGSEITTCFFRWGILERQTPDLTHLRPSSIEKRSLEFQKVLKLAKGTSIYSFICIFALKYFTLYVK